MRLLIIIITIIFFGFLANSYFSPASKPTISDTPATKKQHKKSAVKCYLSSEIRYSFNINGIQAQIPYAANLLLGQKVHPEVTQLIFCIHSSSYNPDYYIENALKVLQNSPESIKKNLIVAPAFYRKDKTRLSNIVVWDTTPFWGSSKALLDNRKIKLSAYEIIDHMLSYIITSGNFPNLGSIIILGHSAGGQLVNRYAACNVIEDTLAKSHNISMRYLVMAPSSYVYMDAKRTRKYNPDRFDVPISSNKKYNRWGYGLDRLYGYHRRHHIDADMIRLQYHYRKVLYLVGEKDTKDAALDRSHAAMLEGENRLERLKIYYRYLQKYYGKDITDYHRMAIIKGVGHHSRALMLSKEGIEFILNNNN